MSAWSPGRGRLIPTLVNMASPKSSCVSAKSLSGSMKAASNNWFCAVRLSTDDRGEAGMPATLAAEVLGPHPHLWAHEARLVGTDFGADRLSDLQRFRPFPEDFPVRCGER